MRNAVTVVLLLFPVLCYVANSAGAISGLVREAQSKKALRGVTVRMPGTHYGAVTDQNGRYLIKNIKPGGPFTLEVSFIGYSKAVKTGIRVADKDTLTANFDLKESNVTLDKDVVVVGNRPLVDVEETQSIRVVGKEQIQQMVAETVSDVIVQQIGIVAQNREVHIRGSRGYEAAYLIDGVSVQDPLAGTGFGLNQISSNVLDEVEIITGGFNPEHGQSTSGVINLRLRDGGEKLESSGGYRRAQRFFQRSPFDRDTNSSFGTDIVEFSLSGPEPLSSQILPALGLNLPGKVRFLFNVYGLFSDDLVPAWARTDVRTSMLPDWMSPRQDNALNALGKLSWIISPTQRLTYTLSNSTAINQNTRTVQTNLEYQQPDPGYQYPFQSNLDGALTYATQNRLNSLNWFHNLSARTHYEVRVSSFVTHLRVDANGRGITEYRQPEDIPTIPAQYFQPRDSTRLGIIPGDGFFDTGTGFSWREHYLNDLTLRTDVTHYIAEGNRLKTGVELIRREMQQAEVFAPWLGPLGLNNDVFNVTSMIGALYVQNNISFKGLVLNYGLRMDMWAPGELVDNAIENLDIPTITDQMRASYRQSSFSMFGRRWKARISPRVGVSHPVTNNQMLFFNYGHFNKIPRPQFVYAKLNPQAANSTFQRFGNPDLNPETSISYELGLRNQLTENDVLTVIAYYKDIFDYVQTRRVENPGNPRLVGGSFFTYINADYVRSRGLEVQYDTRFSNWLTASAQATYTVVTGKSSAAEQGLLIARGLTAERITEDFMPWDRPLTLNLSANATLQQERDFLTWEGFDNINAFVRFFFQSGIRYTGLVPLIDVETGQQRVLENGRPMFETDFNNPLAKIGSNWWWLDLNLQKKVMLGGSNVVFSLEVMNLFDIANPQTINPATGREYQNGDPTPLGWNDPRFPDLEAPLNPYPFDPSRFLTRRTVRFGMNASF